MFEIFDKSQIDDFKDCVGPPIFNICGECRGAFPCKCKPPTKDVDTDLPEKTDKKKDLLIETPEEKKRREDKLQEVYWVRFWDDLVPEMDSMGSGMSGGFGNCNRCKNKVAKICDKCHLNKRTAVKRK